MARLVHVRVDPDRLGEELARPDVVALVERGYRLAAVLPFEERGSPILMLILHPPVEAATSKPPTWMVGLGVGIALVVGASAVVQVVLAVVAR